LSYNIEKGAFMFDITIIQKIVISQRIDEISIFYTKTYCKKHIERHLLDPNIEKCLDIRVVGISLYVPLNERDKETFIVVYVDIRSNYQKYDIEGRAKIYFHLDGTVKGGDVDIY
jgi:hypothetical protein